MKKVQYDEEGNAIKTKWFSVSPRGMIYFMGIIALIGVIMVLVFNVGFDHRQGCYWKPNDLDVDIKLKKEKDK